MTERAHVKLGIGGFMLDVEGVETYVTSQVQQFYTLVHALAEDQAVKKILAGMTRPTQVQ